jgi:hypothetical protein
MLPLRRPAADRNKCTRWELSSSMRSTADLYVHLDWVHVRCAVKPACACYVAYIVASNYGASWGGWFVVRLL